MTTRRFPPLSCALALWTGAIFSSFAADSALPPAEPDPFQALVRPTGALAPEEERGKLKVPPGFEVRLFASEPMINKPINLAFDARGRLWLSSTTEYPFPAAKERWLDAQGSRVRDSRDAIKILEDTDGDGRADRVTDFADGLNVPIGVLPYGRGCIAWSVPNIWYLEDTDGDGKCDRRTVLFGPLGYERDTHGNVASLRLGRDGWVYATHGFNNISRVEVRPERLGRRKLGDPGTVIEMQSGNTFRFRPDGSAVEIWTRGQVNPFGLCFDSFAQLYSADCHSDPIMQLLHGSHYPSFGRPHDGLGFGPVMCPHRHGSTGLCGLVHVHGEIWGADWDEHMLIGNVVTSRINHDQITFTGSSAHAIEQPDFLVSEDPWFRPVDLQIGPEGALYVADFYNKIIGHYEVPLTHEGRDRTSGRIWRITRANAGRARPASRDEMVAGHWRWKENARPAWGSSMRATAFALMNDATLDARVRRVVAEGIGFHPDIKAIPNLASLLERTPKEDEAMRHTLRIGLRNHLALPGAFPVLRKLALPENELLPVIRAVDSPTAAEWLLAWLERQEPASETLETMAVTARRLPKTLDERLVRWARNVAAPVHGAGTVLDKLTESFLARGGDMPPSARLWAVTLAGELAGKIEGIPVSDWKFVPVAVNPGSPNPWQMDKRQNGAGERVSLLATRTAASGATEKQTGSLLSRPFACPSQLRFLICGHRGPPRAAPHNRNFVRLVDAAGVELMRAYPPRSDVARPVEWNLSPHAGREVRLELTDGDNGGTYAWLGFGGMEPPILKLELPATERDLTSAARIVSSHHLAELAPRLAGLLVREDLSEAARVSVAASLARFPGVADSLAKLFKTAPTRVQLRLAEVMASTVEGAMRLCDLALPRLLAAPAVAQKLAGLNHPGLAGRVRELTKALPSASEEAENLIAHRLAHFTEAQAGGRIRAGNGGKIFAAVCAACHRLEGLGGLVGPQLDGVKNRGAERLCEDILDPNRAVDPAFRTVVLTLKDGSVATGLVRRDEGGSLALADAAGQERVLAKTDIVRREESQLSLMPANLGELIPENDFNDLLAWLLTK